MKGIVVLTEEEEPRIHEESTGKKKGEREKFYDPSESFAFLDAQIIPLWMCVRVYTSFYVRESGPKPRYSNGRTGYTANKTERFVVPWQTETLDFEGTREEEKRQ